MSLIIYSALGAGGGAALGGGLFVLIQKMRGKSVELDASDKVGAFLRGGLVAALAVLGMNLASNYYKSQNPPSNSASENTISDQEN